MEKKIEELARTRGHNSFVVLAEWLRENRISVETHLKRQDQRLEEIYREVRNTNGRVSAIEQREKTLEAVEDSKEKWEAERSAGVTQGEDRVERKSERRERKRDFLIGGGMAIAGGAIGSIGHALGIW